MKFSLTGQEKGYPEYRRLLNRGECLGRFDFAYLLLKFTVPKIMQLLFKLSFSTPRHR
jgi:hypothetical protein